jgi:hypothetical protein
MGGSEARRGGGRAGRLVGARRPRIDSEVDLVLLTTAERVYLDDESWVVELGGLRIVKTQQ